MVDTSLEKVVEYTYDAWGKVLSTTGSLASTLGKNNPFRYRSYYYDNETGFYYLQSRYYDPVISRFINADEYVTTGQGLDGANMFSYCGNDPVNRADNNGEFWHIIAGGAVGAVISGTVIPTCNLKSSMV
jgi:RHS repeat-associated protein